MLATSRLLTNSSLKVALPKPKPAALTFTRPSNGAIFGTQGRREYSNNNNNNNNNNFYSSAFRVETAAPDAASISPLWFVAASVLGFFATDAVLSNAEQKPIDYDQVRKDIEVLLDSNPKFDDGSYGPILVRLAWHASGTYDKNTNTGGSCGATMRFPPESDHGANRGLDIARRLLEPVKAKHPGISYADLWTLAGVVAIEHMRGPKIPWRPGRVDAADNKKTPPDGRLPDASKGPSHIRDIFYRMGFDDREIVALIGAHTLGNCHPERSGYKGPWTRSPTMFSNSFFQELLDQKWQKKSWKGPEQYEDAASKELMMLPADLALLADPTFRGYVELYAKDEETFFKDFSAAFSKLLELGVDFQAQPQQKKKGWWPF